MAADLGFSFEEAMKSNPAFKMSDLQILEEWIKNKDPSSLIPKDMHKKQLLLFYNACEMIIDDTKKCIKTYYSIRDKASEHFSDRNMDLPLIKESQTSLEFAVLPEKTKEGYDIIFHRLHDLAPEKYHFNPGCKMLFMTVDACLYDRGPQEGIIFLFDMKGVKLGHLTRVNIISLSKFFTYIQDAMPARIKAIHIMHVAPFFDKVMALMKPFMKKELVGLMKLHSPDTDMEKFYKEVLPKRCLPADFGGDLPDTQTLNKKNCEKLISLQNYFDNEEKHRMVYSKKKNNKNEIEPNFKDLSLD